MYSRVKRTSILPYPTKLGKQSKVFFNIRLLKKSKEQTRYRVMSIQYPRYIIFIQKFIQVYTVNISQSVQSLSRVRLCNPMNHSMPRVSIHHHHPEFTQIHVHRVSDAIQPSHPLSSPSPPAPNPSHHQSLFQ